MTELQLKLEQNRETIINDYNNGVSATKIGKNINCNGGTIWNFLKKNGIPIRDAKNIKKNYDYQKIQELLRSGKSASYIAKELKIHRRIVESEAAKIEIDLSVFSTAREDPLYNHTKEIIRLYEEGVGCTTIANQFDCGESNVIKLLKKNNIDIRFKDYQVNEQFLIILILKIKPML